MSLSASRLKDWHSRGYLPHFDGGGLAQFITFRLEDSLPQVVLERWRRELSRAPVPNLEAMLRRRIESYLDCGYSSAYLREPLVASSVQDTLLYHDAMRYRLAAWCVMPNHVHLLATPMGGHSLSTIMHSLKSYTSNETNKILKRIGQLWQEDYFDRYIRDADHYHKTIAYIENNLVKARLCKRPEDWPYSSAYFRYHKHDE